MLLSGITKKMSDVFSEVFSSKDKAKHHSSMKYRKLTLDHLEERQMLSVSSVMSSEQFVNQTYNSTLTNSLVELQGYEFLDSGKYYETSWGNESIAGNNQGDFVVVWSQNDKIIDPAYTLYHENYELYKTGYLAANPNYVLLPGEKVPEPYKYVQVNGKDYSDWNVYARYFTDEVQRITLPETLLQDNLPTSGNGSSGVARVTLMYAPYEVQQLSFKTANEPFVSDQSYYTNMKGSLEIGGVDVNGDGRQDWVTIYYDEMAGPEAMAEQIRLKISSFGYEYSDVSVQATSANDYLITYGESAKGLNMPELQVRNIQLTGFYAGALVTTVSEPMLVTNYDMFGNSIGVIVDPNNPYQTAANIQAALSGIVLYNKTGQLVLSAGVEYGAQPLGKSDPSDAPVITSFTGPTTSVVPVKDSNGQVLGNVFDITFVDGSGKIDQPELMLVSAKDEYKIEYVGYETSTYSVQTLKESSGQFRVNAPEEDNPNSGLPGAMNQMNASVAMDADGDFVITWQGEVRLANNQISTNVYARRFTPQAYQADTNKISFYNDGYSTVQYKTDYNGEILYDADGKPIQANAPVQGVRPLGDVFQVNTFENGYQMQPSIGMDRDGNFIIAWSDFRQNNTWFSGITAKWFDRDGKAISADIKVSPENNYAKTQSSVALSNDGYAVITYYDATDRNTDNDMHLEESSYCYYYVYAPGDYLNPIGTGQVGSNDETGVAQYTVNANVSFDANNRFLITYTKNIPTVPTYVNTDTGIFLSDAYAEVYAIQKTSDSESGTTYSVTQIYTPFNVSGLDYWTNNGWAWPGAQLNAVGGFDADGDMVFAWQGYGPDFSTGILLYESQSYAQVLAYMQTLINGNKNSDLLEFFNPKNDLTAMYDSGYSYGYAQSRDGNYDYYDPDGYYLSSSGSVDVDFAIRYYLTMAQKRGANDEQLGRLNACLETVFGPLRGSSNDIMTTQINTGNWQSGSYSDSQSSDAVITSVRDGENYRMYIAIPKYYSNLVSGGSLILNWWRDSYTNGEESTASQTMTLPLETTDGVFDPDKTLRAWGNTVDGIFKEFALFAATKDRDHEGDNSYSSAIITLLDDTEIIARIGTAWEISGISYPYLSEGMTSDGILGYWTYEIVLDGGAHDQEFEYAILVGTTMSREGLQGNFAGDVIYRVESYGEQGTEQLTPNIHVLPNGSYVVSWVTDSDTTNGTLVNRNLNYRYFSSGSDSAKDNTGPIVTDILLPNGDRLANNGQVTSALRNVVVTFDEELISTTDKSSTNWKSSVANPANWALMKDGVEISGAIADIQFGLNRSMDGFATEGVLTYGTNKWEAVITFDANGLAAGDYALGEGQYELVLKNSVCDTAGNALGRQGLQENGANFSRKFTVTILDGVLQFSSGDDNSVYMNYEEQLVNDNTREDQSTRNEYGLDTPRNPNSVASDDQGNFVIVWESDDGIHAKVYRQTFTEDAQGNRIAEVTVSKTFLVTTNNTATYASVAMDSDGDFIITWVQESSELNSKGKPETSLNVFAKLYDANGDEKVTSDASSQGTAPVNSYTDGIQNYPSVAMDARGDFVITWESWAQDGSGYGIYYQRFDSMGTPLERTDEIQAIQLTGKPAAGTFFTITFMGVTTANIRVEQNANLTAENILKALNGLNVVMDGKSIKLEVDVQASSSDRILIQFLGALSGTNISQISVDVVNKGDLKLGQSITATTMIDGMSGEKRANDTTLGDQRYPAIAMSPQGEFIITWTSKGQDADSQYETNIYAKSFPSNDSMNLGVTTNGTLSQKITAVADVPDYTSTMIVSVDPPENHEVDTAAGEYTGVVMVVHSSGRGGSGTLLTSGLHILTAAHVVCDDIGNVLNPDDFTIYFDLPSGRVELQVSEIIVHNSYNGDYLGTSDIAIIKLAELAPTEATRYDIYRGGGEVGTIVTKVGYGTIGTGESGYVEGTDGVKHVGLNKYEANSTIFQAVYPSDNFIAYTLTYDFDNGTSANDAFGQLFGIRDFGLGNDEVSAAPGDSGGPGFITDISGNQLIAGVTSYGVSFSTVSNVDTAPGANSSFGDAGVDVQVSAYVDWIDAIVSSSSAEFLVNETEVGNQVWADVAISTSGEVIFTWTSYNQDLGGSGPGAYVNGEAGVYARRFNLDGTPARVFNPTLGRYEAAHEFLVNSFIPGNQYYSSVDIAANGDFIITWESFQDRGVNASGYTSDDPSSYGIYAKRYINTTTFNKAVMETEETPRYGLPDLTYYIAGYGYVGYNGEIGNEILVNKTLLNGNQTGATVTVNANGDAVVVFQSEDTTALGTNRNIYYRLLPLQKDNSAPTVTDVRAINQKVDYQKDENGNYVLDGNGDRIPLFENGEVKRTTVTEGVGQGAILEGHVYEIILTMSEEMYNMSNDVKRITDVSNWSLSRNGITITGTIVGILFEQNPVTGKWEVTLKLDSDLTKAGYQPLLSGTYQLTLKDTVTDLAGNNLDGNYDGQTGGNFIRLFYVIPSEGTTDPEEPIEEDPNKDPTVPDTPDEPALKNQNFTQNDPAIASKSDGSFVIVGVDYSKEGFYDTENEVYYELSGNIVMRTYDKYGNPKGNETTVNNYTLGNQITPDVAMDAFGNIAIVWSGNGQYINSGIFCRIYDSYGMPVNVQFQVNVGYTGEHYTPKVAFDENGNIVVTWIEYDTTSRALAIWTRVFDTEGNAKTFADGSKEKIVVSANGLEISDYDIDMDQNGNLVLTWKMYSSQTKTSEIFAKVINISATNTQVSLSTVLNTFQVNTYTTNNQLTPTVAISSNGTFVIAWASEYQDGSDLGVYARRFNLSGQALSIQGTTSDAKINLHTLNMQGMPDVSISDNGNFAITWTSFDQEGQNYGLYTDLETGLSSGYLVNDYGVFVRAFNNSGKDLVASYYGNGAAPEQRVNDSIFGNQMSSVITVNDDGFSVAWVGPDYIYQYLILDPENPEGDPTVFYLDTTDIYYRVYRTQLGVSKKNSSTLAGIYAAANYSYSGQGVGGSISSSSTVNVGATSSYTENPNNVTIQGTNGQDVVEINITAKGIQVSVNGVSQNISSTVKNVYFDGLDGNDKLIINGYAKDDTVTLNARENYLSWTAKDGSYSINATNVENVNFTGGGGSNTLFVVTPQGGSTLDVKGDQLSLSGSGLNYSATGFQVIDARSSSSYDYVHLYDTAGDDHVEMHSGAVSMIGDFYSNTLVGFKSVTAYSSKGNDTVSMYGTEGNDSLLAGATLTSLITGTYRNAAQGFKNVYVYGNGGVDTAMFSGTQFNDTYTGTVTCSSMLFGGYNTSVSAYDFAKLNVVGNGGYDKAILSGKATSANVFTGEISQASLTANGYSQTLKGFSNVKVIGSQSDSATLIRSTTTQNVQSDTDIYSMINDDQELYRLIAFGHVEGKMKNSSGDILVEAIEKTDDYLMKLRIL